jgi:hypothetical protein
VVLSLVHALANLLKLLLMGFLHLCDFFLFEDLHLFYLLLEDDDLASEIKLEISCLQFLFFEPVVDPL